MIRMISVKCPECGAALDFEEERQTAFCSYCGTKIILHNENEYIIRNFDEAEIRQAENDRICKMKELELEEKEESHRRMMTFVLISVFIAAMIVCLIMIMKNDPMGILLLIFIITFGFIGLVEYQKGKNRGKPGYAMVPDKLINYSSMHYTAVEASLRAGGFTNIKTINLGDLRLGLFKKNGSVESVMINDENITRGGWYPQGDLIVISYHGFPDG